MVTGNPKLRGIESPQSRWYRYYAGFSERFARTALESARLGAGDWVLDPWNGSGTTTATAAALGLNVRGYDLNPVMVLVAKARCLDAAEYSSLRPLASEVLRQARKSFDPGHDDPLSAWLRPRSIAAIRGIEAAIQKLLVDNKRYTNLRDRGVDTISGLAAFFYVGLFRTLRELLQPFATTNPTWIKRPSSSQSLLRPHPTKIIELFERHLTDMLPDIATRIGSPSRNQRVIRVASSEKLPLEDNSINQIITSPPYCTRIDYAVSTSPELALLGYEFDKDFETLRRQLIGTPTVPSTIPKPSRDLGPSCSRFLDGLNVHASKASSTYYYKNHVQYFRSIGKSLSEIGRVLRPSGQCVLVVQDSYYKNLHNDLPSIFTEMAGLRGLHLRDRRDFTLSRTLAGINPGTKGYRRTFSAVESVLVLARTDAKSKIN
jgi:SAM-dependent methyltransferase